MAKLNLLGQSEAEFVQLAESMGEKPFRGRQLYHQIYCRKELDVDRMTDLSRDFRRRLQQQCVIRLPHIRQKQLSEDGTRKFLLELEDGRFIESVYIPEEGRDTLCISSQVGCGVGCTFCRTAQMGFIRNLKPGEILAQIFTAIQDGCLREQGFNIVFMGMGEPLYNYRNLMKAFRIMVDPKGMGLSHRKITVSTSGVVPVLRRMAAQTILPNLAISLNATTDPVRDRIMPINRKWDLEALLKACRDFPLDSRRRITLEYVLLAGETDSEADARRLAKLLRGLRAKVNLIPYNPNPGLPHRRPEASQVERFRQLLLEENLSVFVRKTRGEDVSAACGQLAYREAAPLPLQVN